MPPLLPSEFLSRGHQAIWVAMQGLAELDGRPSLPTLHRALAQADDLALAGGPAHLALCVEEAHVPAYVPGCARQIREAARERALHALGQELAREGLDEPEIRARLDAMPGPLTAPLYDARAAWHQIEASWGERRILTHVAPLDTMTAGLTPGELVVVAGRTSAGKTAWCCHLALALANHNTPATILTLEETEAAITRRLIANLSGVPVWKLKTGTLTPSEERDARLAVEWIAALPLRVVSLETVRVLDEGHVVATVAAQDSPVVFIDHLQKIATGDDSRVYGLERVMNALHAVGVRQRRVLITACQLSRLVESEKRAPRIPDIRDSGAIEQAARQIWLLHWPARFDPTLDPTDYELHVAKNSDGGTGVIPLRFDPRSGRFAARG